jgi:hypothetical protein
MSSKKNFFNIPTHILIIMLALATLSLFFEIFTFFNIGNYDSITVNGLIYNKSNHEYHEALSTLKGIILSSISFSALITSIIGYFSYKRIRIR